MAGESRPTALFLAPEAPYPIAGGGALRSASLLEYLARSRDVDVIVFRQPGEPDPGARIPSGIARRVAVIQLPEHSKTYAARAWRNGARLIRGAPPLVDRFAGFERQVEDAIAGRRYDLGVVEHFWCAPYWRTISPACAFTVLDLHNVESELHARCARFELGPQALAHRAFRRASLALERVWLPRYSRVLAASEEDAGRVRRIEPAARVMVYPNALRVTDPPPRAEEDVIVFSGNMEYHPNTSAVRFFHREIWPALRERWPGLVWRLVGCNPQAVAHIVRGDPRVELRGAVDDAIAELARAKVAVVPLLAGSGTRFKILEAWAAGTPVVSTRIGAEGLGARDGEDILIADSPAEFAGCVTRLLASPDARRRAGISGRLTVQNRFSWDVAWNVLDF